MKILHTSDWHLGKRLFDRERIDAQRAFGDTLIQIVKNEGVGLVLVTGDVFDTSMPSSLSENLFYDIVAELGKLATVLIVSGNHDDPERLSAANQLARANNIVVVSDFDVPPKEAHTVDAGEGWIRFRFNWETVNVVALPYPTDARMGDAIKENETYAERVKNKLARAAKEAFAVPGVRIVASHLFCAGGIKSGSERDIELGTARIVPLDCLPDCDYCALGHIHRPMRMSERVWYSGAPMPFTFDDDAEKFVNIYDTVTHAVRNVPLPKFDRLRHIECDSVESAIAALDSDPDALTQLTLKLDKPLLFNQTRALRSHDNLVKMTLNVAKTKDIRLVNRDQKTPEQLFTEYCHNMNVEPKRELIDLFLNLVGEV